MMQLQAMVTTTLMLHLGQVCSAAAAAKLAALQPRAPGLVTRRVLLMRLLMCVAMAGLSLIALQDTARLQLTAMQPAAMQGTVQQPSGLQHTSSSALQLAGLQDTSPWHHCRLMMRHCWGSRQQQQQQQQQGVLRMILRCLANFCHQWRALHHTAACCSSCQRR
jgi:hypothetical protein